MPFIQYNPEKQTTMTYGLYFCPECKSEVLKPVGKAVSRCQNFACPAQIKGRLKHFVSKLCMNIDGFGEKLIEQLVDNEIIFNISDIYRLSIDDIQNLDRQGEKSAKNTILAQSRLDDIIDRAVRDEIANRIMGAIVRSTDRKMFTYDSESETSSTNSNAELVDSGARLEIINSIYNFDRSRNSEHFPISNKILHLLASIKHFNL